MKQALVDDPQDELRSRVSHRCSGVTLFASCLALALALMGLMYTQMGPTSTRPVGKKTTPYLPLTLPKAPNTHSVFLASIMTTRPGKGADGLGDANGYTCIWVEFSYNGVVRDWCLNPNNEDNICDTFSDEGDAWPLMFDPATSFSFLPKDPAQVQLQLPVPLCETAC